MPRRLDIRKILRDPRQRRELMVRTIIATQAREGITTTRRQAEEAYDRVRKEANDHS
jgi:hypothetical protein